MITPGGLIALLSFLVCFVMTEGKGGIMKDVKTKKIDFRVTPEEKSRIKEFAKQKGMTVGELIRNALMRMEALDKGEM